MTTEKLLKRIKFHGGINYTRQSPHMKEELSTAYNNGLIYFDENDRCHLTCSGEDFLHDKNSVNMKFRISTSIAIFAAIGGYREEIRAILALLEQALKQLSK